MIDWRVARYIAGRVGGEPAGTAIDEGLARELVLESEERVRGYTLMTGGPRVPAGEVVSRAEWVHANTLSMGPMLDAAVSGLSERVPTTAGTGRGKVKSPNLLVAATVTLEAGLVLGVLSRRVLGQYDIPLIPQVVDPEPRLLLVGPNISAATASFGSPPEDFLRWVAIHEVTHAVQFASVPWLRGYMGGMAADLLGSLSDATPTAKRPLLDVARAAAGRAGRTLSGRDPFALMLDERQHELVGRMQAAMSVIEGHAEHVMDAAGAQAIPSLAQLRASMSVRRQAPNPLWRVVSRLLGMEMKMRQYEQGRRFCDAVVAASGVDGLNRVWAEPAALPSAGEIENPGLWLDRQKATV